MHTDSVEAPGVRTERCYQIQQAGVHRRGIEKGPVLIFCQLHTCKALMQHTTKQTPTHLLSGNIFQRYNPCTGRRLRCGQREAVHVSEGRSTGEGEKCCARLLPAASVGISFRITRCKMQHTRQSEADTPAVEYFPAIHSAHEDSPEVQTERSSVSASAGQQEETPC